MSTTVARSVPVLDLTPEIDFLRDALSEAFQRVLRSGQFVGGPEVEGFESEAADFLGVRHVVGVNSGTDALIIALRSLGIGPGDEVLTTPFSFFATAESVSNVGAVPRFVDIDEATFNIDATLIEAAITPRTKAILPVHLYGRPADMDSILEVARRHGLKVIEDCAQSFGARYLGSHCTGTLGHAGAFSFFPSKNLGALGDGGMLVTDDDDVAAFARKLRAHGSERKYHNEMLGYNSRLDALQAAFLRAKLPSIPDWNESRREVANRYDRLLRDIPSVLRPEIVDGHVFHQYTVRIVGADRDLVRDRMAARGISTMVYYPVPQDRLPVYASMESRCPVSDRLSQEVLSLPIWPSIDVEVQGQVAQALAEAIQDRVR